jgi:hypothetical protein
MIAFARSTCASRCSVVVVGETVVPISSSSLGSGGRLDDRRRGRCVWVRIEVGFVVEQGLRGRRPLESAETPAESLVVTE